MTPEQCRRARLLLHWSAADLARAAGVSVIGVRNFEDKKPGQRRSVIVSMTRAFEGAGVGFGAAAGEDFGVTLAPRGRGPGKTP